MLNSDATLIGSRSLEMQMTMTNVVGNLNISPIYTQTIPQQNSILFENTNQLPHITIPNNYQQQALNNDTNDNSTNNNTNNIATNINLTSQQQQPIQSTSTTNNTNLLNQQPDGTSFLPPITLQQMSMQNQMRMLTAQRSLPSSIPYQQAILASNDMSLSPNNNANNEFNRNYYEYSNQMIQQQHLHCIPTQMPSSRMPSETSAAMASVIAPPPVHMYPTSTHFSSRPSSSSSSHHATASATDPCAQIAHVLQCYQQGGEDAEFVRKAIESLVKKLKDKRNELENLITAVTSGGKQPTSCVTIQRSLDGRLQVAGRKGVPHVVYARIWRWPNVSKNELQKLSICGVTPDNQDVICINPYHYERVVSSAIGNIDMSTLRLDSLSSVSVIAHTNPVMVPSLHNTSHPSSAHNLSTNNVCNDPSQQNHFSEVSSHSSNDGVSMMRQSSDAQNVNPWIGQGCAIGASTANQLYQQSQGAYQLRDACRNFPIRSPRYDLNAVVLPLTTPPDHWCSISYYELDTQIGETFKVRKEQSEVYIDGGVNPAGVKSGRFCLGALPNVHRCEASEKARLHIGKGVRISTQRDGSVYLACLSHKSVFVRSYYLDFEHNIEYGMTVHKFCSGAPNRKIFDLRWAYAEMEQQNESARFAVVAQAAAVAGYPSATSLTPSLIEHAGTGVDDLRRVCCTIAISFVKGWGPGYNRTSIKETPCWVELQLHRPLQLLDQLLKKNEDYGCK